MKKMPHSTIDDSHLPQQTELQLSKMSAAIAQKATGSQNLQRQLKVRRGELDKLRIAPTQLDSSLELYTKLDDFIPVAYFMLASDSSIVDANQAAEWLLGIPRSTLCLQHFAKLVAEESQSTFNAFLEKTFSIRHHQSCEVALKIAGRLIWIEIKAIADPLLQTCRASVSDITERKQTERRLQVATMAYQAIDEAILITDASYRIVAVNPAFTKLTGYTEEEVVGQFAHFYKSECHDSRFYLNIWKALRKTGHWQGEIWKRRKNGEIYLEWLRINTNYDSNGKVLQRVAISTDITDRKRAEETMWKRANFDQLTCLPNRYLFYDRMQLAIKQAYREGRTMALMLLDLDRFKEINDTLGHDMGDSLLLEIARRLNHCVRETDTVARLGGDEFAIILNEMEDRVSIERIAQGILQQLAEPLLLNGKKVNISASIGITFYPEDASEIETLMKNADQAMYDAKEAGRNRFSYFTHTIQETVRSQAILDNDLRDALADNQLQLHYQPIIELASGVIYKAEALIRWRHPQQGWLNPTDFIAVAEKTGLIVEISDWVFKEAARQVKLWRRYFDKRFQISINGSPMLFHYGSEHQNSWFEHLQQNGLTVDSIGVEIGEGLLLDTSHAISSTLSSFCEIGMPISIDDFGTGCSSLSCLQKFHIAYLKIDRSFVSQLLNQSNKIMLCEAMIAMAHKLKIKVIAEGVETHEQREQLEKMGCDFAQGYLLSKPLSAEAFDTLLQKRE
ncbi:putative bifunctional diguanylate cyclase/phosphodiesterase [Methylotuvimicrobium alcaliphilum]|uniref:Diguanylate cyclase/phosphodiesterase with PAS/PAC sensor(S) n=1 Tax=Methylotuvimicrobium alcaliphilum (strain DSM 19304 / NCIMB 14124 / VKM B-2133 / 20Z) TaxID=1091494 RepID=G4SWK9_META2|nr:EAL domain-containing protein [Methylotuvimicrobium alcaliphilum]CCE25235.1 Diguanylate cyclase/phosphodiesterase with PAS/PAC sensor(S) [Methylotuvimicrobium alcaliphilum 20Z]